MLRLLMVRLTGLVLAVVLVSACGPGAATRSEDTRGADVATGPVEAELRRFPGVEVRETADGVEVRVRGGDASFLSDGEPLYVVDGVRRDVQMGGGLVGIRRGDILDIRVLKSASETSAYGSRGANGVVLIRTRHAAR